MVNGKYCPPCGTMKIYMYIYLGLGSYQLTIKERNNGVGFVRSKNRVVEEFASHIADMNHKGFSDGKFKLL
jgi:hypothetical protein